MPALQSGAGDRQSMREISVGADPGGDSPESCARTRRPGRGPPELGPAGRTPAPPPTRRPPRPAGQIAVPYAELLGVLYGNRHWIWSRSPGDGIGKLLEPAAPRISSVVESASRDEGPARGLPPAPWPRRPSPAASSTAAALSSRGAFVGAERRSTPPWKTPPWKTPSLGARNSRTARRRQAVERPSLRDREPRWPRARRGDRRFPSPSAPSRGSGNLGRLGSEPLRISRSTSSPGACRGGPRRPAGAA